MNQDMVTSVDPETLSNVISKPRDRGTQNRLDDEDMLVIQQLHNEGVPMINIAKMLHIHRSTVYRALDRMKQE